MQFFPRADKELNHTSQEKRVKVKDLKVSKKYIAFYKPYGILSQFTGERPEETLGAFNLPSEVYAAGRLDKDSEGLLLLTNDGALINNLAHPKAKTPKVYLVQVDGSPTQESLKKMEKGLAIKNYITKPCFVKKVPEPNIPPRNPPIRVRKHIPTTWLEVTLFEGKNRQVRRMTAAIGHPTLRLIRTQISNIDLGTLRPGQWKPCQKM